MGVEPTIFTSLAGGDPVVSCASAFNRLFRLPERLFAPFANSHATPKINKVMARCYPFLNPFTANDDYL